MSWFWTKRVPGPIRRAAKYGAVGVHPSLLPRHRGPDPTFWAIELGDTETGVTAHALDDDYDTGAILGQRRIAVDPSWTAWRLAKKLDRPSLALLRETVGAFARGEPPTPKPQRDEDATSAPLPTDDLLDLRWRELSADEVERRVRAASPWPGAFTEVGGEIVTLTRVRVTREVPDALEAGEAYVRSDRVAVVKAARGGGVELHAGRIDDEEDPDATRELDVSALASMVAEHIA